MDWHPALFHSQLITGPVVLLRASLATRSAGGAVYRLCPTLQNQLSTEKAVIFDGSCLF